MRSRLEVVRVPEVVDYDALDTHSGLIAGLVLQPELLYKSRMVDVRRNHCKLDQEPPAYPGKRRSSETCNIVGLGQSCFRRMK